MRIKGNRNFFEIWLPAQTTLLQLYHDDGLFYWAKDWDDIDCMCWHEEGFIVKVQVKTEYLDEFRKILEELGGRTVCNDGAQADIL